MRVPVPLSHAYRLLNHGPTTLVTTAHEGRRNVMAAAWAMPLATAPASQVHAPLVESCAAWLECRALREPAIEERYDLFVLECVAAWADDALFREGSWQFAADGPRTIHHDKGGRFFATGALFAARR